LVLYLMLCTTILYQTTLSAVPMGNTFLCCPWGQRDTTLAVLGDRDNVWLRRISNESSRSAHEWERSNDRSYGGRKARICQTGASGSARTYQANREARGKVHGWLRLIRDERGRKVEHSRSPRRQCKCIQEDGVVALACPRKGSRVAG
jgi:ribosomal protein L34